MIGSQRVITMNRSSHQQGFSLIEVLVTLVLVAIGVLGMVALQGRSIQYTQYSVQRNSAVMLVNDLTEIIRANPEQLFDPAPTPSTPYYGELKATSSFYKEEGDELPDVEACVSMPKSGAEQLGCWVDAVERELPGGESVFNDYAYICRSSTKGSCDGKGSMLEIQLAWQVKPGACPDSRAPTDTVCIYRTRVEL